MFAACVCVDDGQAGASGAPSDGCFADPEWCDGQDNDCNGLVDDHFACRDDRVSTAFTQRFEGGVYFSGYSAGANCPAALQQFWPESSLDFRSGFDDCYTDRFRFRRSDGELFYNATFTGILRDTPTTDVVEPASCGGAAVIRDGFDFSAENLLHFQCGNTLRRGDAGAVVAEGIEVISSVLDDGRTLVTRMLDYDEYVYSLLSADGTELNRFPPPGFYTGRVEVRPFSTSVVGNIAYTLLLRTYDQVTTEFLLYAVDEDSIFRLVRRLVVPSVGLTAMALSDGTILVYDAALIRAYLPDSSNVVAFLTRESIFVSPDDNRFSAQLVVGPRVEALP